MSKFVGKDLVGHRFGRLVVIAEPRRDPVKNVTWMPCKCDCGATREINKNSLTRGSTKSCGCLRKENTGMLNKTHGYSESPEYQVWKAMRQRCSNPKDKAYPNYGGRGIDFDPRWACFENFIKDMGERPSSKHTLERKDNEGGYTPDNCEWATRAQQSRNRRNTIKVISSGSVFLVDELAEKEGRTYFSKVKEIYRRYRKLGDYYLEVSYL